MIKVKNWESYVVEGVDLINLKEELEVLGYIQDSVLD